MKPPIEFDTRPKLVRALVKMRLDETAAQADPDAAEIRHARAEVRAALHTLRLCRRNLERALKRR